MSRDRTVAIVGLGYVGLPLLVAATRSGWQTIGIDVDEGRLKLLKAGKSPIEDVTDQDILALQKSGKIIFTSEPSSIESADVVVFCLPTPVSEHQPDLRILMSALHNYAPFFKDDALIVSESSSYPGTLREVVIPICEIYTGTKQLNYGYSPERVDPGNRVWNNTNTPRIISGIDSESLTKMRNFYGSFCQVIIEVDTPEIAEAAKMFENAFRQVNIALVIEFARYCHSVGIPANKVLDAAATKPFGFMKFKYGAGVGGHCIPVDPYYLVDHAKRHGSNLEIINLSNKVVAHQPQYVLNRIKSLIGSEFGKSRVLVVGISYKANTADQRESPGVTLIRLLNEAGLEVYWHDPLCSDFFEFPRAKGIEVFNLAIVTVLHDKFDYAEMFGQCEIILDCTHSLESSHKVVYL